MLLDKISLELARALEDARHYAERREDAFITPAHLLYVMMEDNGALASLTEKQGIDRSSVMDVLTSLSVKDRNEKLRPGKKPVAGETLRNLIDNAFELAGNRRAELVMPTDILSAVLKSNEAGQVDSLVESLNDAGLKPETINKAVQADEAVRDVLKPVKGGEASASVLERFGRNMCELVREGKLSPVIGRDQEIQFVIQTLLRKSKNNPVLVGDPGTGKSAIVEGLAHRIVSGDVPDALKKCKLYSLDLTLLVAGAKYRGEFEERIKNVVDEVASRAGEIILFLDELHTLVGAGGNAGGLDAANILKPALARGQLRCIGATTYDEYRESIEKDGALARRFEQVIVEEPDDATTLEILRGIRGHYEEHHNVKLTDESLEAAVKLSRRYLRNRFMPDKAIDVIDEASAKIRMQGGGADSALEVKKEDIADVVARRARIPSVRLFESDKERMLKLEERIMQRVFGQNQAIDAVADAARRMRTDLRRTKRPASFLFVGPTGVGKTETARAFAEAIFDDDDSLIRIDMAEYKDESSISGLIGSRPGLVGSEEGGFLTERVRRQPYSVILFDEVEKAHPQVLDLLLGALGEGRLTDAKGRFCDFSSAIVIFTSNLGVAEANELTDDPEKKKDIILKVVKANLRPELFNRLDDVICFNSLDKILLEQIVKRNLDDLKRSLNEEHGIDLSYTTDAISFLADRAYDPAYGARPVERTMQREVLSPAAKMLITEEIKRGNKLDISYTDADGFKIASI